MMLWTWQEPAVSFPVDTHIPMWQALVALVVVAGMWCVAMYRINSSDKKHDKHFDSIRGLENAGATIVQQMNDHQRVDEERFGRIEEMLREGRDDIKEILRSVKR